MYALLTFELLWISFASNDCNGIICRQTHYTLNAVLNKFDYIFRWILIGTLRQRPSCACQSRMHREKWLVLPSWSTSWMAPYSTRMMKICLRYWLKRKSHLFLRLAKKIHLNWDVQEVTDRKDGGFVQTQKPSYGEYILDLFRDRI